MTLDIVSLGEPLVEFNETGGGHLRGPGGDASNFAVAAARQNGSGRRASTSALGSGCVSMSGLLPGNDEG